MAFAGCQGFVVALLRIGVVRVGWTNVVGSIVDEPSQGVDDSRVKHARIVIVTRGRRSGTRRSCASKREAHLRRTTRVAYKAKVDSLRLCSFPPNAYCDCQTSDVDDSRKTPRPETYPTQSPSRDSEIHRRQRSLYYSIDTDIAAPGHICLTYTTDGTPEKHRAAPVDGRAKASLNGRPETNTQRPADNVGEAGSPATTWPRRPSWT